MYGCRIRKWGRELFLSMDLLSFLPDDLLFPFFLQGFVTCKDAVSFALSSRKFHALFLTSRERSFNFRLRSYINKKRVYNLKLVERYFFRFDWISRDEEYTHRVFSFVNFFHCYDFEKDYDYDGAFLNNTCYDKVDARHRISDIGHSSVLTPLVIAILRKIELLDVVEVLFTKTRSNFPEFGLQHDCSNVFLNVDYSSSESDHRPIYRVWFRFEFNYASLPAGPKSKSSVFQNTMRGNFRHSYILADGLLDYLTKLAAMDAYKEGEDFIIRGTQHIELHDTSIKPTSTEIPEGMTAASVLNQ